MSILTSLRPITAYFIVGLLSIFVCSGKAFSEDAVINAVAFHNLPQGSEIAVKPWDNSDENMKTAKIIETQLLDLGYRLSSTAQLTLSFESKNALGRWSRDRKNTSVEFRAEGSTAAGKDAEVRLNLFSSSDGGILNPSKKRGENVLTKVSLEITIDQKNGPRLWQGEALAGAHQTSTAEVARQLAPILLNQLGKTVRQKSVIFP